jgi:hypothetical protein
VVLNEGNQKPVTGRQLYFQTTPDFSACLMDAGPAYPGYALRRFLVLCPPVLIDAFMVQGKTATTIDWVTHVRGLFKPQNLGMTRLGKALAERNGYQHLRDVRQAAGAEVAEFAWEQPSGQVLRIFCLGDGSSTFYAGLGIGTDLKEEVPFLIRRRTAESTLFLTVYDLSGKPETGIAGIARLTPTDPSDAVCGVRISFRGRQELRAWLDLREKAEPEPLAGGGTFTRFRLDQSAP